MLLNETCFYPEILHAYAILDHANAVLDQEVLLTRACFYLENQVFGVVLNQDMLLVKIGSKKYKLRFSKYMKFYYLVLSINNTGNWDGGGVKNPENCQCRLLVVSFQAKLTVQ